MRTLHSIRAVGVGALVCIGLITIPATASYAISTPIPIDPNNPFQLPIGVPPVGMQGISVDSSCGNGDAATAFAVITFLSGNAHMYGPASHPLTNGGNVEGTSTWQGFDPNSGALDYDYIGFGHVWGGSNNLSVGPAPAPQPGGNAQVSAETLMFHGVGENGTTGTLDVQGSFGETISASGHVSGWGHLKVSC